MNTLLPVGRTLLLGDIGNRLDIKDTERDIASLKQEIAGSFRKDMSQEEKIGRLITENAQLKLGFTSLILLLIRKGSISQDELAAIVAPWRYGRRTNMEFDAKTQRRDAKDASK